MNRTSSYDKLFAKYWQWLIERFSDGTRLEYSPREVSPGKGNARRVEYIDKERILLKETTSRGHQSKCLMTQLRDDFWKLYQDPEVGNKLKSPSILRTQYGIKGFIEFKRHMFEEFLEFVENSPDILPGEDIKISDNMNTPRVFISYSWDGEEHRTWVRYLAERLCQNGIDARLDQWLVHPGHSFTQFMEEEAIQADYVVIVCTPAYAQKSNGRKGGVGYEQQIISGQLVAGIQRNKFVPIIRSGNYEPSANCAIPNHFAGIVTIDFRNNEKFDDCLEALLRVFFRRPKFAPPPIGRPPQLDTTYITPANTSS